MSYQVFKYNQTFYVESGEYLPEIEIAYSTFGKLNPERNNVVWVVHALTANSDPTDWWSGLVGEGRLIDPEKYFIVCANNLGSCYGSTHALSLHPFGGEPYYHTFPLLTIRDIAASLDLLRNHLNINQIHLCIGGSQGGQIIQEWAISQPKVFENLFLLCTNAAHSPWGIAFNEAQRMAIEADVTWESSIDEAGSEGMKAARAIALLSYRNYQTYAQTQASDNAAIDKFKASSYQQYQGKKLVKRFNAFSYWTLSKAMDSHNVGRGRGSIESALSLIQARTLVLGIRSDVLFPIQEQQFLATHLPNAQLVEIDSIYGHDGFLIEYEQISKVLADFLVLEKVL
ncbi:MAG: homoserine O-acetyltransferase [Microscillaceae bacterium]|jgi:homoserine O-acetyltransferase|nr:homoserine O-acetyltransferase [Microscillaceae bacterium]